MQKKNLFLLLFLSSFVIIGCAVEEPIGVEEPVQTEEQIPELIVEEKVEEAPEVIAEEKTTEEESQVAETKIEVPVEEKLEKSKTCGNLFDAYTRLQGGAQGGEVNPREIADLLKARMDENNVGCALVINDIVKDDPLEVNIEEYADIVKDSDNKFVPFFELEVDRYSELTKEKINNALAAAEGKVVFKGYGEISFADPGEWQGRSLNAVPWLEIFPLFAEKNLAFATHPKRSQGDDLSKMLTNHPDVTIIAHGEISGIKDLLVKHKNLYYAAELETMLTGIDGFGCSPILVTDSKVNKAISEYGPIIAAAPEQVLWATNVASKCHFSRQFYSKLIEFTDLFLEKLPAEHRDKFAYENALKLFGLSN